MLTQIGDILNWSTAGLVFPLMLLPLAALFSRSRVGGTLIWLFIVLALASAGALFAALAPRLGGAPLYPGAAIIGASTLALGFVILLAGGPAPATAALAPFFGGAARLSGRLVMWLVFLMAFVQFAGVIMRYVFGLSFLSMQESITYMHGVVFLLAAGYAFVTDDHVRVDIFYRSAGAKRKALVDFLGAYLFLFPVALLILWASSSYVGQSWAVREGSAEASGVPAIFLLKSAIPAFALLVAMAGFAVAAKAVATMRSERAG